MEEEKPSSFEELIDSLKEYFNLQKKIMKLEAAEKATVFFSEAISLIVIFGLFFAVFFFLSFALAYVLSDYFGKMYAGFVCVAGLYLLVAVILFANKDKLLKNPLMNIFIKSIFGNGRKEN